MALLAVLLCLLVADLGAIGLVTPSALVRVARYLQTPVGLYGAAAFRVLLGYALLRAAAVSRAPRAVRAVGVVVLVSGLLTPLFGLERFRAVLEWGAMQGPVVLRLWAGLAIAFGFLTGYAIISKPSKSKPSTPRPGPAPRGRKARRR